MIIPSPSNEGYPGLIPHSIIPENLEAPLNAINNWITPNNLFYVRNHFSYPQPLSLEHWCLEIKGEVNTPLRLSYQDLINMPQVSLFATLECSGNRRSDFLPKTFGEQWKFGAIGNAKWSGVPLNYVLSLAGLSTTAKEIVFTGFDQGPHPELPGIYNFSRSLPTGVSLAWDTLLVLDMNDEPLPFKHGFPLRLLVPGWYGMASVKWLKSINAIPTNFRGPFQAIDYVYLFKEDDYKNAIPVTEKKVNSVILYPSDRQILKPGIHRINGVAWSGSASISRVEVSTDNGQTWQVAALTSPEHVDNTWTFWEHSWVESKPGEYTIMVRALDSRRRTQPWEAPWNVKGYGNNSIHKIRVKIPKQLI